MHFGHLVYAKKRLVMRLALANEVECSATCSTDYRRKTAGIAISPFEALARAVRETIACFPVIELISRPANR